MAKAKKTVGDAQVSGEQTKVKQLKTSVGGSCASSKMSVSVFLLWFKHVLDPFVAMCKLCVRVFQDLGMLTCVICSAAGPAARISHDVRIIISLLDSCHWGFSDVMCQIRSVNDRFGDVVLQTNLPNTEMCLVWWCIGSWLNWACKMVRGQCVHVAAGSKMRMLSDHDFAIWHSDKKIRKHLHTFVVLNGRHFVR